MTTQELYQHLADQTGEDLSTIESLGFEIEMPHYEADRKELKRQRRLRQWRQQRRDRRIAKLAERVVES